MANFDGRDIISITDFSREDILDLCCKGEHMAAMERDGERYGLSNSLKTRSLAYMFYEPSVP